MEYNPYPIKYDPNSESEKRRLSHPYFKIMDLPDKELRATLETWSRLKLIDWLAWNDKHGVFRDEESMEEFGNIMSKEEALELMHRIIMEGQFSLPKA